VLPLECFLLLSQSETSDKASVSLDICLSQVLEKVSSLTYHLEQASSRMEVLVVLFEMLVKVIDSVSKDSYLNLRGSCVAFLDGILFNN
jgi:hypothetical protein